MSDLPRQIGPFDVIGELGRGAMGVVYRVHHRELDREFALKLVGARVSERPDSLARFRREAQAAARLASHPNIVGVHQIGETDGTAWFSMDLIDGDSFETLIDEGDMPLDEAVRIVAKAARAVDYAHDQSVLHRDLKPANILVGHDGEVYVTDFGLARLQDVHGDLTRITTSDLLVGTPAYMAPEQIHGESLDGRADVYALGATLYEAITGSTPFPGSSILSVLTKVVQEPPPLPTSLAPGIPADLEAICLRALAKEPVDRYPTAVLFAEELEAFLAGKPILARRSSAIGRLGKRLRRNRTAVIAGVVGGMVLGGALGSWWAVTLIGAGREGDLKSTSEVAEQGELSVRFGDAYRELTLLTRDEMLLLEDAWFGSPIDAGAVEAARAVVVAKSDEIGAKYPEAHGPKAWAAFAELMASGADASAELTTIASNSPQDPFPAMLLARAIMCLWVRDAGFPTVQVGVFELTVLPFVEPQAAVTLRTLAEKVLTEAGGREVMGSLDEGDVFHRFGRGLTLFAEREYEESAQVLESLAEDPAMGALSLRMAGTAWMASGKVQRAADAFLVLTARGWPEAFELVAAAETALAARATQNTDEAIQRYLRAVDYFDRSIAIAPARVSCHMGGAMALCSVGDLIARRGQDPQQYFDQALERLALVDIHDLSRGPHRSTIASLYRRLADWDRLRGIDPQPSLRRAMEALGPAPLEGWEADWRGSRAGLLLEIARDMVQRQGVDGAEALLDRAIADLEIALSDASERRAALIVRAEIHRLRADLALQSQGDPVPHVIRALEDSQAAYDAAPTQIRGNLALISSLSLRARFDLPPSNVGAEAVVRARELAGALVMRRPDLVEAHLALAEACAADGQRRLALGQSAVLTLREALAALGRAADLDTKRDDVQSERGNLLWLTARAQSAAGEDSGAALRAALIAYTAALERNPGNLEPLANRSLVHTALGDRARRQGGDPMGHYQAALDDAEQFITARPRFAGPHHNRGTVLRTMGDALVERGRSPEQAYADARAAFDRALELDSSTAAIRNDRGLLFKAIAKHRRLADDAGIELLQAALADFTEALRMQPGMIEAHNNRGNTYNAVAEMARAVGNDPRPALQRAQADFDALLEQSPKDFQALNNRALVFYEMGRYAAQVGDDPEPHFERAIDDFTSSIRLNAQTGDAFTNRSLIHTARARAALTAGTDATPHFRAAIADNARALQYNGSDISTLINQAFARLQFAEYLLPRDAAAGTVELEAAAVEATAALKSAGSTFWQPHALLGRVRTLQGRRDEAFAAFQQALEINPEHPRILGWLAEARKLR